MPPLTMSDSTLIGYAIAIITTLGGIVAYFHRRIEKYSNATELKLAATESTLNTQEARCDARMAAIETKHEHDMKERDVLRVKLTTRVNKLAHVVLRVAVCGEEKCPQKKAAAEEIQNLEVL